MLRVIAFLLRGIYNLLKKFFASLFSRFWFFILTIAPELVKKIMVFLGIGFTSYVGADYLIGELTALLVHSLDSVPADILNILQLCKFDKGLSILIAALTICGTIKATSKTVSLTKSSSS
jgi:hypothetical protein